MQEHRLLIVEDESIVAMDVERRLQKLGYQVVGVAADGAAAMGLVEAELPDLILMDIHIQGNTDGIDVASQIHQLYHIPVIFLTAFSEDHTLARAREAKPYGYLLKPFTERDLHASIQMALERFQHDRAIRKSETHLRLALDSANLGTWEVNSPSEPLLFGYMPRGDWQYIANWKDIAATIVEDDREAVQHQIELLRKRNDADVEIKFRIQHSLLGHRWLALYGKSFLDGGLHDYRAVGVIQDVTRQRQMESQLEEAAMVYQCSADGIVILDANKKVLSANQAFQSITGFSSDQVVGSGLQFLEKRRLGEDMYQDMWDTVEQQGSWQGEVRGYCENGDLIYVWLNIARVPNSADASGQFVVIFSDITAVHDAQEKLSHIAYYDTLTNLPNRNLFVDRLDHALAKSRREGTELALFFIDLDHFKRVNDTLGHQIGDLMLRSAAQRLKHQLRETDTLCRIGGDEFIVIVEGVQATEDIVRLAEKLLTALEKPLKLGVVDVIPSGSIGISLFPQDADNRNDLVKMADTAMYAAKNSGRNNYSFYRVEMTDHTAHYMERERELRTAIEENQFCLYYQPQFDAVSQEMVGVEALIRWQHPTRGLLPASEVIPVAEGSSLIADIGEWVLNAACSQIRCWMDHGFSAPRVAINTSVRQLESRGFVHKLQDILAQYRLDPSCIELEITESCLQGNEVVLSCLQEVERQGVTISIDDFGTGYSCMSSLKLLPVHKLKIDQSFVRDIPADDSDCAIASAITALAKQLQLTVVAEGIETPEQAEFLKSIGCDELQGFLLSHPIPPDELERLLEKIQRVSHPGR